MPDRTIMFEMSADHLLKDDALRLLEFAETRVREAGELARAGQPCEQVLDKLLQSQRALRVVKTLVLAEQVQTSLRSIQRGDCPETRCEELQRLIELYPYV